MFVTEFTKWRPNKVAQLVLGDGWFLHISWRGVKLTGLSLQESGVTCRICLQSEIM